PDQVAASLWDGIVGGSMHRHILATLEAAAWGYLIGGAVAITLAVAVAEVKLVERFLYAPVVALQAIPKVAIAPVIFVWAGFDIGGKIALVALVCFFPIFANTLVGLRTADRGHLELYSAVRASRFK